MFSLLQMVCLLRKGNVASSNSELVCPSLGHHWVREIQVPAPLGRKTSRTVLIRVSLDHMTIPQLITVIKSGWGEGTRTGTEAHGWNGGKGMASVRGEVKEVRRSPGRATSHCSLQWLQHTPPSVLNKMTFVLMGQEEHLKTYSIKNNFLHVYGAREV